MRTWLIVIMTLCLSTEVVFGVSQENYNVLVISRAIQPTTFGDKSGWASQLKDKWKQVSFGKVNLNITFSPLYIGPFKRVCGSDVSDTNAVIEDALSYATVDYGDFSRFDQIIVWPNEDMVIEPGPDCTFSNSGGVRSLVYDSNEGYRSFIGPVALDVALRLSNDRSKIHIANVHEFAHGYNTPSLVAHTDYLRCQGSAYSYPDGHPELHNCAKQTPGGTSPLDILGLIRSSLDITNQAINFSGSKKLYWGWITDQHVAEGEGIFELHPIDSTTLTDGVYLHKYKIPGTSWSYSFEYKAHAPAFPNHTLPGVYVYAVNEASDYVFSYLLTTEPSRNDTILGVAPVVERQPRLIDAHLDLYLEVLSVGETAAIRVYRKPKFAPIVAVGGYGQAFASQNGIQWEPIELTETSFVNAITYGAQTYVASGGKGQLWISEDGFSWTERTISTDSWYAGTYCHDRFYIPGANSSIASSTTTTNWAVLKLRSPEYPNKIHFYSTACGEDRIVLVGSRGYTFSKAISANPTRWKINPSSTRRDLFGVAYGDGVFVAVGQFGTLLRSQDGINWTNVSWNTNYKIRDIVFTEGRFVAVGYGGTVLISDDLGLSWTMAQHPEPDSYLLSIAVDANLGRLIVGGTSGKGWISDDLGTTWTTANIDRPGSCSNIWGIVTAVSSSLANP